MMSGNFGDGKVTLPSLPYSGEKLTRLDSVHDRRNVVVLIPQAWRIPYSVSLIRTILIMCDACPYVVRATY